MQKQTIVRYENLGETKPTGRKLAELFYEVQERFENMLPTTFTSQYEGKELVKALSTTSDDEVMAHAIVSRLVVMRGECAAL